jgi:L-rhamnose isomerase
VEGKKMNQAVDKIKADYQSAKKQYAKLGVDTEAALAELSQISISMHCWQGDDVIGFEGNTELSGGIQATGNYPGRARTPEELMADIDQALSLIPGQHRLNLHASYAIFNDDNQVDRNQLKPEHFKAWVDFAKTRGLGIDFNPTFFSHPKAAEATLSSQDEDIRKFWIEHGQCCLRIAEYFAEELDSACTVNIWIPDGLKDVPADRTAPRARLKDSLDQIIAIPYDKDKVNVAVESKVFGIGLESYTVGSHEFYMNYAAQNNLLCLLDNGHYHPTESVADKISAMLLFYDKVALHVTRPVRWDSDHVVLYDDRTKEIAKEIIRNGSDRVILGLDFFDASINRISAWVVGMRNMQKALLNALLLPADKLAKLQDKKEFTKLMMLQEELKLYPVGAVWNYFCQQNKVPEQEYWFKEIEQYEKEILSKRQ